MIKVSACSFLNMMESKSYEVLLGGRLNIVGYRNRFGSANHFDDTISVYVKEGLDWKEFHFLSTTLPGTPHMLKPVNPHGAAILVSGQYLHAYALGKHLGKYTALCQVRPVKVYRDNNRDTVYDKEDHKIEEGLFGINIHRASLGVKVVGPDSAGCQVIKDRADYELLISMCQKSAALYLNRFSYTLVDI